MSRLTDDDIGKKHPKYLVEQGIDKSRYREIWHGREYG